MGEVEAAKMNEGRRFWYLANGPNGHNEGPFSTEVIEGV